MAAEVEDESVGDLFVSEASKEEQEAAARASAEALRDIDADEPEGSPMDIDNAAGDAEGAAAPRAPRAPRGAPRAPRAPLPPRRCACAQEQGLARRQAPEEEDRKGGGGGAARPSASACQLKLAQKNQNAAVAVADRAAVQRRLSGSRAQLESFPTSLAARTLLQMRPLQRTPLRKTKRRRLAPLPPAGRETSGRGRKGRMTEKQGDAEELAAMNAAKRATRLTVQPECIKFGTMRDYQIEGLNWLISLYDRGINGILADEMGLGKTLQTISILGYLNQVRGVTGPHLVIVPKSTLELAAEFKVVPLIRAKKLHGSKTEQAIHEEELQPGMFDVIVTYECVILDGFLNKIHWVYIAIDEAHRIKRSRDCLPQCERSIPVPLQSQDRCK